MIRLGVAGCRRGRAFLPVLRDAGFELAGAMDPDPARLGAFAKEGGLSPAFCVDRFEGLLDLALDAVYLASPMPFHVPQAVAALARGVHVLSEVPAAVSFGQCLELREAVRASNARYMMAENALFTREVMTVSAMARADAFGDVYYAEGEYLHDVRNAAITDADDVTWRKYWQMDRRGATYATHAIAPPLHWFGDRVAGLSAAGTGSRVDKRFGGDDSCVMVCETAGGKALTVRTDLRSPRPKRTAYYALQGTAGCFEAAAFDGDHARVYLNGDKKWRQLSSFEDEFLPDMWRTHRRAAKRAKHGGADFFTLLAFADVCRGGASPIEVYAALEWTLPGLVSELSVERGGVRLDVPDPRTGALDEAAAAERDTGRVDIIGLDGDRRS